MARKKRKATSPASAPSPPPVATESAGVERILLPALGALVWLALLDGTVAPRAILHPDSVTPRVFFRELFQLREENALVTFPKGKKS